MNTQTPKPFIGFILSKSFKVKPVEVRPHPVMASYGLLPTGGRIRLAEVFRTPHEAIQTGVASCKKLEKALRERREELNKRLKNLREAEQAINSVREMA